MNYFSISLLWAFLSLREDKVFILLILLLLMGGVVSVDCVWAPGLPRATEPLSLPKLPSSFVPHLLLHVNRGVYLFVFICTSLVPSLSVTRSLIIHIYKHIIYIWCGSCSPWHNCCCGVFETERRGALSVCRAVIKPCKATVPPSGLRGRATSLRLFLLTGPPSRSALLLNRFVHPANCSVE